VPEDDLFSTDEVSNLTPTTTNSGRREASSEVSPVQFKRRKPATVATALGTMSDQKIEVDKGRLELLQRQFEIDREERERRLVLDERRMILEEKEHEHRMVLEEKAHEREEKEHERRMVLEEKAHEREEKAHELAVQKLELEKKLAEERTLMLQLQLENLRRPPGA
jgi:hypothetical protein